MFLPPGRGMDWSLAGYKGERALLIASGGGGLGAAAATCRPAAASCCLASVHWLVMMPALALLADGTPTFSSPQKLFDVREFGAKGDGVANDTAALQVRR